MILLDLSMPGIDPVAMVGQLSKDPTTRPPVIVLSAKPERDVQTAALSIGAAAIVRKPFPIETLLQSIEAALIA